jgi:uroporphyrin-III C-methyltransferase / precorrin-2 dehydrogenase / sirohydrochlorin ferrochelatase
VVITGHVWLVGAGPGDPGLLTRRAMACLRRADLVLYDALVDQRVLRYARRAQKFFVGKRAGRHAVTQPAIHGLMIRAARKGRRVVRLKGGDPFVFGRGGEEALALQQAGIPFDVVPGVTSAVAAPAAAGIPVTHRGLASAFLVASGHDESTLATALAQLQPNGITLVILMGLARSAAIAALLVDRGWSRGTPAAVIVDGTCARQQVWRGRLDDLAADRIQIDGGGAGTIVIGNVAALELLSDTRMRHEHGRGEALQAAVGGQHVRTNRPGRPEGPRNIRVIPSEAVNAAVEESR